MPATEKQIIGKLGEDIAADYLKKNGYKIIGRNVHLSKNELDVIAEDRECIVFVEVKTRSCIDPETGDFGIPSRAVDATKRKNTVKAVRDYLCGYSGGKRPRIDVIEVYLLDRKSSMKAPALLKINHIRNAFDARGNKQHS